MRLLRISLFVTVTMIISTTVFAGEVATFAALYKEGFSLGWIIAALLAVFAMAAVVFTGGTASPLVAGIGTWIGGTMGLSGAAATNAGLALLGGGSIASGGFGIIGGAAVLTAALKFSTDVVFDYTVGTAVTEYKYRDLAEKSKDMVTLPLPVNDDGPASYRWAIEALEGVDKDQPIHANGNARMNRPGCRGGHLV